MEGMNVKAPQPGCGDDGAASAPSLSAQREDEKEAVAVAAEDEQVERFYALLANIRAMRAMYSQYRDAAVAGDGDGEDACRGGASRRKRVRRAELPWRPAFSMEDFEEATADDDATCSRMKQRSGYSGAVEKRRTDKEAAAATADDDDEEGEVVEGKGQRAAASQRAGPLTS